MSQNHARDALLCGLSALLSISLVACQTVTTGGMVKDPEQAARTRTDLAAEYIKRGQLDAAQRSLEQALTANPQSAEAHQMMGILLQSEGSALNLQRAEGYYQKAIALKPDFAQARNNYGVYLSARGRDAEAIKQFEIAGATLGYEGRASALENLGRTALKVKQPTVAKAAFEKALSVNRGLLTARLELATLLLTEGRVRDATKWYDEYAQAMGKQAQPARALWLGMRLARLQQNQQQLNQRADELQQRYPQSDEYQRYMQVKQNTGMPWN